MFAMFEQMLAMSGGPPPAGGVSGKSAGMFLKLLEIQRLLEAYRKQAIEMCAKNKTDWRMAVLSSMRSHLTEEQRLQIDLLIKFFEMNEIIIKLEGLRNT
jgi:hypothetical protein